MAIFLWRYPESALLSRSADTIQLSKPEAGISCLQIVLFHVAAVKKNKTFHILSTITRSMAVAALK
jgi:hypothetical protein